VILDDFEIDEAAFAEHTGWVLKPEGACKGELCVPLPDDVRGTSGRLDPRVLSERLGMPLVHDEEHDVWALGPAVVSGHALESATPPDVELEDVDGNPFRLSSLHGKKVLLVAWASW
jgi:hypothetical protein